MSAEDQYKNISPIGRHFVVDYWDCDAALLNDQSKLATLINEAAELAGASVLATKSHSFYDQGVTAISLLEESHISIHTWPENKYAGVDIYTCGECNPLLAHKHISEVLSATRSSLLEIERGNNSSDNSISIRSGLRSVHSDLNIDNKWFFEGNVPGKCDGKISHGFAIENLIAHEKTKFQEYMIFDTSLYGRVLSLDGIIQFSTSDEHIYHDMLIHPVMFMHVNPLRVLIVGGGDGAALREVLRHNPEKVVMVNIDEEFVRGAAEHLPSLNAGAFDDPRLEIIFEDANSALNKFNNEFDVAIIDCNDAIGTSKSLFEEDFYKSIAKATKDDALCAIQAGSSLDLDFLTQLRQRLHSQLGQTSCFKLTLPSYHCGEYVFMVAAKNGSDIKTTQAVLEERQLQRAISTNYWSPEMHFASQVFPPNSPLNSKR